MRIMLISPEDLPIPPIRGGSVQIYLSQLAQALTDIPDVDVTLVSPKPAKSSLTLESSHLSHIQLTASHETYWRQVQHLIEQVQPDILQIDNRPLRAFRIKQTCAHIPLILNLHSTTFLGPLHMKKVSPRTALQRPDAVVCNSVSLRQTIREMAHMPRAWDGPVIYPGVAHEPLTPARQQIMANKPGNPLRVLFAGRVIQQKGVHIALSAIQQVASEFPVELTVVGRTPPWERKYRLALLAKAQSLPVQFKGFVTPDDLFTIYQEHDIFICPSQRHEAFGLVNLEAMSNGLPVVASHIGGIPEAVGPGGILIQRTGRPADFADALRTLRDEKTYQTYQRAAMAHANSFTWLKAAAQFAQLYVHLVAN